MLKILADRNLYKLENFIPKDSELTFYDPGNGIPDHKNTDAWLLRTVTNVNEQTVPDLSKDLQFIGTGSSGSDHIDKKSLQKNGVKFADAKGCNARAVAEYVLTALLLLKFDEKVDIESLSYGIIGVGAVGTEVGKLMDAFGFNYKSYDPPREEIDPNFTSCSLDEVLECDALTFHVPYEEYGNHPTKYWLDETKLANRNYKVLINASRGGILKEEAVKASFNKGHIDFLVIDVWENEPDFDPEFAELAYIATPHIAGYSEQAKLNASSIVVQKMLNHFGTESTIDQDLYQSKYVDLAHITFSDSQLLKRLHPIMEYDAALRDLIGRSDRTELFRKLREDRPFRFEYGYLSLDEPLIKDHPFLKVLGISNH